MKRLSNFDLAQNELQNAVIQNLAAAPSSPKKGQIYFNTGNNTYQYYDGTAWQSIGSGTATGTVTAVSVASANGFAGTVANPTTTPAISVSTTVSGLLKGNGTSISAATSGTDYAPPTATTSSLKGNGSGGFSAATLNDNGAPTADYSMNSHKLTNLLDPTTAQDAATKNYVDATAQGLDYKQSVAVATTANITLSGEQTIDGVTTSASRILVKNQSTASANGIYVTNAGAWTRATDASSSTNLTSGALVYVEAGTANGGQQWVLTTTGVITVGTTSQTWSQFSGASTLTAGSGLTSSGNTFNVGAGTGIVVNTDSVTVDRATNGATVPLKYSATVGDGASTSIVVTHGLGTQDVHVQLRDATSNAVVECDITMTSTTQVTLSFATAPASNSYRVVIIG